jgi:hypothetical protein
MGYAFAKARNGECGRPTGRGDKALGEANMKYPKIGLLDRLKGAVEFWLIELQAPKP